MCLLSSIWDIVYNHFLKKGVKKEYVKSCGNMGMALYHLELPYSAEAYLVKTASFPCPGFL